MRHCGEQPLAAEPSVERVQVDLADPCFRDGAGLRVPPGRGDELREKLFIDVWITVSRDLVERAFEHCKGIRDVVRVPERAAQLEGDRAAPRTVGQEVESGAQMVGRGRA